MRCNYILVDLQKLEVFIGLQYLRGINEKGHPVAILWSRNYGISIFYKIMGCNLFLETLKPMKFDDKPNRNMRESDINKCALTQKVYLSVRNKYVCDFSLTVDEQLIPCKSMFSFISFMPNKPNKYEINFGLLLT